MSTALIAVLTLKVVAALLTFFVIDVAGIVRGEVSRIWAYFGPLLVLLACLPHNEATIRTRWRTTVVIGLVAAQLIAMNTRRLPYPSFLDEPLERVADFRAPRPQVPSSVSFDRQIELLGYDLKPVDKALDLTAYWQALVQPQHPFTIFAHALLADGKLVGQHDGMPQDNQLPTSCWQSGEVVTDHYTIPLESNPA